VITGTHIQDETIEASDIKDGSITSEKIVVSVPTPKALHKKVNQLHLRWMKMTRDLF
jgi:hypothetical protein